MDSVIRPSDRDTAQRVIPKHQDDQPVVDCAHGYQKENQEEAVEENCGQEGGADEEGSSEKSGCENEGRRQEDNRRKNGWRT
jgi:hypothetical protein